MIDRMANLRAGFRTTRACGPDGIYELNIKFQSLEDLDAADKELRSAFDREEIDGQPLTGSALAAPGAAIAAREQAKPGERRERITDADLDVYEGWLTKNAERRALLPIEQAELMNTAMLCIREVKATRAAAPGDVTDEQIQRAWLTSTTGDYIKFARDVLALATITQPATVQQAETPSEKQQKLLDLADRIDHEQLWRWAGMDHHKMTPEQKDRMNAGVALRRYARLWAPGRWVIFPPIGPVNFSASTLDKAFEMATSDDARRNAQSTTVQPELDDTPLEIGEGDAQ